MRKLYHNEYFVEVSDFRAAIKHLISFNIGISDVDAEVNYRLDNGNLCGKNIDLLDYRTHDLTEIEIEWATMLGEHVVQNY